MTTTPLPRPWSPHVLRAFLMGDATLAELEGLSTEALQEVAALGFLMAEQGRLDIARELFEGLHLLDPFDSYALTALGAVAQRQGDLTAADGRYGEAIALNPTDVVAFANRGDVRLQLGRLDEAVADLERSLALDPEGKSITMPRTRLLLNAFNRLSLEVVAEDASEAERTLTAAIRGELPLPGDDEDARSAEGEGTHDEDQALSLTALHSASLHASKQLRPKNYLPGGRAGKGRAAGRAGAKPARPTPSAEQSDPPARDPRARRQRV